MDTFIFPNGLYGLIFDCDGVMIDSEEANRFYYNSILSWLGLPPMDKSQEEYAFMATALDALKKMVPASLRERIPEAIDKGISYDRDVLPRIKLMPGFRDFIEQAHEHGLRMAIDTNRTALGIQRVLDFFDLPPYFDPVLSSSNVAPKPSPEGLELVCKLWGRNADQLLFIGDSANDRQTARNAGTLFAAFGGHGLQADIDAPDYRTLARILWGEQ